LFGPYDLGTDLELAGIYVSYEDVKDGGPCYMLEVLGSEIYYEVTYLYGVWFCGPCKGFYFRGSCSHVKRAKRFIEKRGVI